MKLIKGLRDIDEHLNLLRIILISSPRHMYGLHWDDLETKKVRG